MRTLILASAFSLFALQAHADPRLGTKACIVENATAFSPYTGKSGEWLKAQKSFVLNVYECEVVWRRKLDMGWDGTCDPASPDMLAIQTTLEDYGAGWDHAAGRLTLNDGTTQPIVAEFRSSRAAASEYNRPTFRLYPDMRFEFFRLSMSDQSSISVFFLTGTCADFQ